MRQRSFFLLLLFTVLGSTLSAQSIRSLLRKGKQQYEVHAYTKAIETYQEVLARRGDQVEALSYLAACYRQLNQMEEAADHYALALEQANQVEDVHILDYGKTLKALERYAQAEQIFRIFAERNAPLGNHYAASCEFAVGQQSVSSDYQIANELVNSSAADFSPSFFMDQVVFSSGRTDIERPSYDPVNNEPWDGQARNQLFISRIGPNGQLQPARFLKGAASKRSEGPVSFSPRQDKVAFMVNDYISGTRAVPGQGNELVLFVADLGSNGDWFNEKTFPHNTADSQSGYPCFTPDGGAMFFASNRAGGYGGYDLYIAYREGENWSIPINLGPTVNSPGDEIAPFSDGESLYFASDYHFGFGGFDIFTARQEEGTWVEVKNIGLPINSSRDDYGFIYDEAKNIGYFTSNRPGGRGAEDIYKVNKPSLNKISLRVVNAIDGRPISFANIDLSGLGAVVLDGNTRVITNSEGRYTIPSAYGINGTVLVTSPGYQPENYPLNAASLNDNQEVEIRLSPAGRIYTGSVVSYTNNRPLSNITIIAQHVNSGISRQTRTDQNGNFQLNLEDNTSYMLTYTSPGFREIRRNISTANIANSDLGVLSLASTSDINPNPVPPQAPDSSPGKGYAIQVSAMGQRPYLEEFSNLNSLNVGQVYIKATDNIYRVRYGVFTDRVTANRYLSSVKAKGYRDAYVVVEEGTAVLPANPPSSNTESGNYTPTGNYQIQLAAMKNVSWFNPSGTVRALGQIEQFPRGSLTIMLLGKFANLQEAKQALSVVQRNGYPTAFIVVQQNGQLIRQ